MSILALINQRATSPEWTIGFLGVIALAGYGIWGFVRWLLSGPVSPDPWDEQVTAEVAKEEATPLCHRCLLPHEVSADFCSHCGATVGQYTNWLPYPYLFSVGHTLRIGTIGNFRHSPLTIGGFLLLGLAEYALFSPIYWFVFLRNLSRQPSAQPSESPLPPSPPGHG